LIRNDLQQATRDIKLIPIEGISPMKMTLQFRKVLFFLVVFSWQGITTTSAADLPYGWKNEWPKTDFSKHIVKYDEIMSGGPPKDGIPSIDDPVFEKIIEIDNIAPTEPVVGVVINGKAKAYPLRVLTWHEIVNDKLGGIPITVTYCPLCNSSIVFDRRLDGKILDFGTTGKLRNSDLVMYDRQTESWWQQFLGKGIIGEMSGKLLKMLPSRLESFASFKKRAPNGLVLVPRHGFIRPYGSNPYVGYDTNVSPFLYGGPMPKGIKPMVRVIAVNQEAWSLPLLRKKGRIEKGDLVIKWAKGQNSALDTRKIAKGRDVGNVIVQRKKNGTLVDEVYDVTFAFVFHAFRPNGKIYTK
jgi:hypothetical protein